MIKFLARILYTFLSLVQALIIFRIAIIFFNLEKSNEIITWIYSTSNYFVSPFKGILQSETLNIANFTLELTSVVALFVILILGFVIIEIIKAFSID